MIRRDRARLMADATRAIERDAFRFADAFREQRLRIGVTKAEVARVAGVSPTLVWRVERGDASVALDARARCARAVGGTTRLALYADQVPLIYDARHARMVERLAALARDHWSVTLEAPVPGPGHRSVDMRLDSSEDVVLLEVESHIRRWEELLREQADKRQAVLEAGESRVINVVLALPPTRHHLALVRAIPASVRLAYPVDPREIRRALAEGRRWPGDGLVWIGGGRERAMTA